MTITLITGANKGLGREAARWLLEIDPTSDTSVAAAAEQVGSDYGRLDVLVNNAGTAEPRGLAVIALADHAGSRVVRMGSGRRT